MTDTGDDKKRQNDPDRRDFLVQAALAAAGISAAAIPLEAEASESPASSSRVVLTKPISWNLLSSETKKTGSVTETTTTIELTGNNRARNLVEGFTKRVEREGGHEDSIVIKVQEFDSNSHRVRASSQTILASTTYGQPEGNVRRDRVAVKVFDGTHERSFPPTIVKVPLANPYEGLSDEDLVDKILSQKLN